MERVNGIVVKGILCDAYHLTSLYIQIFYFSYTAS